MPYMIEKQDGEYCVMKQDADGKPEGKPLGKHPDMASAKKQMAALYAAEEKSEGEPPLKPGETDEKENAPAPPANLTEKKAAPADKPKKTRTGYFAELATLEESGVDGENKKVRVTLIQPGWSANNRYYSKKVLAEAAKLFEGAKAFADHPSKSEAKDRPERSVRELVGWFEDTKVEKDGRLTASLNVTDGQLWTNVIEPAATRNPSLAALSINALGQTRMGEVAGQKGIIVEAIVKANSTDIVTSAAAGGRFESLMASDSDGMTRELVTAMSLDELKDVLREARPDLVDAWQKEWKTPRETAALESARDESTGLKDKLAELTEQFQAVKRELDEAKADKAAAEKNALADRVLAEAKLPDAWHDAVLAELVKAADEDAMKAIVETEKAKLDAVAKAPAKIKGVGVSVAQPPKIGARPAVKQPVMRIFGLDPRLAEAKTPKQYALIKSQILQESKGQ